MYRPRDKQNTALPGSPPSKLILFVSAQWKFIRHFSPNVMGLLKSVDCAIMEYEKYECRECLLEDRRVMLVRVWLGHVGSWGFAEAKTIIGLMIIESRYHGSFVVFFSFSLLRQAQFRFGVYAHL